jgi:hypothetical protein
MSFNKDCTICSKFVNHSTFVNLHNGEGEGGLYDHTMSSRIFTFDKEYAIILAPTTMTYMATNTTWNWQSSHTNCVFYILGELVQS